MIRVSPLSAALFAAAALSSAMGPATDTPDGDRPARTTTQEDTSGRLLSLPNPKKCGRRPIHFWHDGHAYFYSGNERRHEGDKVGMVLNCSKPS